MFLDYGRGWTFVLIWELEEITVKMEIKLLFERVLI
jgi:hypothetical protein